MDGHVAVRIIDIIVNETGGDGDEVGGGSYSPITSLQLVWDPSSKGGIDFKSIFNSHQGEDTLYLLVRSVNADDPSDLAILHTLFVAPAEGTNTIFGWFPLHQQLPTHQHCGSRRGMD